MHKMKMKAVARQLFFFVYKSAEAPFSFYFLFIEKSLGFPKSLSPNILMIYIFPKLHKSPAFVRGTTKHLGKRLSSSWRMQ